MYAAIFENGTQISLTINDIIRLSHDPTFRVTKATTNGAQTSFTACIKHAQGYAETWQVVANRYSSGEQHLYAELGRTIV